MFASPLYRHAPPPLQQWLIAVRERARGAIREGATFRQALRELSRSQWLSGTALRDLQEERLVATVRQAAAHVPHYRRIFQEHGLALERFQNATDLRHLPLLTKQEILGNPSAFLSCARRGLRFHASTSGTTGTPLALYQDLAAIVRENAFLARHAEWAGYREGERRAWIRGDMIVPVGQQQPPFWRVNRPANMLMLSSYHLSPDRVPAYVRALTEFDPVVIQAYPSSVGFLASYLASRGEVYRGRSLRGIITSSETLTVAQAEAIVNAFGRPVFDHYGSAERVILIGTCEKGSRHVESDYGYTEWIDTADGDGELVGTSFNNAVMPLIRYRTGDRASLPVEGHHCACGRAFPVALEVTGRQDDYVITEDGRRIGRLDHLFKGIRHVAAAQIRQDEIGRVRILLVPAAGARDAEASKIRAHARERLGERMHIDIEWVEQLPRTGNGKLQLVVSTVQPGRSRQEVSATRSAEAER